MQRDILIDGRAACYVTSRADAAPASSGERWQAGHKLLLRTRDNETRRKAKAGHIAAGERHLVLNKNESRAHGSRVTKWSDHRNATYDSVMMIDRGHGRLSFAESQAGACKQQISITSAQPFGRRG
jgi:hypothetical protein